MAVYNYKVRDKSGKILQGQQEASDERDLRRKLDERDFFIIEYSLNKPAQDVWSMPVIPSSSRVTDTDLAVMSWQLYTLLDAALTLSNSLKILINQTKNETLKASFNRVYQRVEEGSTFSNALKESPNVFSRFYVQMVNAGEVGGVLDEILKRLAVYYERQAEIGSKIKAAMIYPLMLLSISLCVIIFLVSFVLPQFAVIFNEIGLPTPVATRILLDISVAIRMYWPLFLAGIAGLGVLLRLYAATEKGGYQFDLIKLQMPIIGPLVKKSMIVQFAQTLATLVSGGIPILTALDVVTDTIGNKVMIKILKDVAVCVEGGKPIVQPMEESKMFPDMLINMIRVGEETGSLSKMLEKISEFYYKDVYNAIEAFTKLIEPLMMMGMAVVIGFISLAIFMPLAGLMQTLK